MVKLQNWELNFFWPDSKEAISGGSLHTTCSNPRELLPTGWKFVVVVLVTTSDRQGPTIRQNNVTTNISIYTLKFHHLYLLVSSFFLPLIKHYLIQLLGIVEEFNFELILFLTRVIKMSFKPSFINKSR